MQLVVGSLQLVSFAGEFFLKSRSGSRNSLQVGAPLCTQLCLALHTNMSHCMTEQTNIELLSNQL